MARGPGPGKNPSLAPPAGRARSSFLFDFPLRKVIIKSYEFCLIEIMAV